MSPDLKLVNGDGSPSSLPIGETLRMTLKFLRDNFTAIVKVSVIPSALILVTFAAFGAFDVPTEEEAVSPLSMLPSTLITGALMAIIMAAVGRMALFGDVPERFGLPVFGRDEVQTWLASVLTGVATALAAVIVIVILMALTGSMALGIFVAIFPAVIVATALSMIYPIVLISGKLDFRRSVEMARGHLAPLVAVIFTTSFGTIMLLFIVLSFVLAAVSGFIGEDGMAAFTMKFGAVFMVLIQVVTAVVNIAVVSLAFRWIDYYSPDPLLSGE